MSAVNRLNTLIHEARTLMAEGKFDLRGREFTDPDLNFGDWFGYGYGVGMVW